MNEHEKSINEEPAWFDDENYVLTLDDFTTMSDEDVAVMTNKYTKVRNIEPINMYWRINGLIIDCPVFVPTAKVYDLLAMTDNMGDFVPKLLRDSNGIASIVVDIPTHNQKEN